MLFTTGLDQDIVRILPLNDSCALVGGFGKAIVFVVFETELVTNIGSIDGAGFFVRSIFAVVLSIKLPDKVYDADQLPEVSLAFI